MTTYTYLGSSISHLEKLNIKTDKSSRILNDLKNATTGDPSHREIKLKNSTG